MEWLRDGSEMNAIQSVNRPQTSNLSRSGNSPSLKAGSDEDRSGGASSYMLRQSKRYKPSSLIQFLVILSSSFFK